MVFIRKKKINGTEYGYLVKNKWTSNGSRQKAKYLGKILHLDIVKDISFSDFLMKRHGITSEEFVNSRKRAEIVNELIELKLTRRGFVLGEVKIKKIIKEKVEDNDKDRKKIENEEKIEDREKIEENKNPNRPKWRGIFNVPNTHKDMKHINSMHPSTASSGVFETNKIRDEKGKKKVEKKIINVLNDGKYYYRNCKVQKISNGKEAIVEMNEGFLCGFSIRHLLSVKPTGYDEREQGIKLAKALLEAGLKVEHDIFVMLFEKWVK